MSSQEYETTLEQQKQFSHSAKLEETVKGCRISVHVYGNSSEEVRQQLIKTYLGIEHDLQSHDVKLCPMSAAPTVSNGG